MRLQSAQSMLEITCVQEIPLALIYLNILGKASLSIQEVSESVQAQGCYIKTWKWKQKLAWVLGNTSDFVLLGCFSTTIIFPCESTGCRKKHFLNSTALAGICLTHCLFLICFERKLS